LLRRAERDNSHQVRASRGAFIPPRVEVEGVRRESKKGSGSGRDGWSKMKRGEGEIGFERLGGEGGEKVKGGGVSFLGDAWKGVGGDGQGAAGEKFGKVSDRMNGRGAR